MIQCPRCQNTIDETKRTACPVCLAPLTASGAPQRTAMPANTPPYGAAPGPNGQPAPTPPYTPPTGTPYAPTRQTAAPPPGSHYVTPPLAGAPPPTSPPGNPGYAPAAQTRTTLTGEVVPVSAPSAPPPPGYNAGYPSGGYTSPGSTPYSGNQPHALSYNQPTPAAKSGGNWWNWRIAGGGALGGAYVIFRLVLILVRFLMPHHGVYSGSDYSGYQPPSSYSSYSGSPYSGPRGTQPQVYTPPVYQPHFQPPPVPTMPSSFPGRGSFGRPAGSPFGNR